MQDETGKKAAVAGTADIFEKLNMGVLRIDPSLRIVYANPFALGIMKMKKEEAEGMPISDVLPVTVSRRLSREVDHVGRGGVTTCFEAYYPGHENLWLSFRCVPDRNGVAVFFEDITELRRTREDLTKTKQDLELRVQERTKHLKRTSRMMEEQKELMLSIIDNIPVMLVFFDSTGTVRLVNREFERLAGWSLEEARRMNIMAAMFPDPAYRKEVWEFMMRARSGWKDLELTTRSGRILQSSWANVFLSDGSQIGIGIDISERIQMERELMRLASAIEQADEGVAIFNPAWEIEYVDPALQNLSGIRKHDLIGRPAQVLSDFFPGDTFAETRHRVEEEGRKWTGHRRRKKETGEAVEINLAVSPVYDEQGKITNFILLARDVTDETRLQQQLLQIQKMEAIGSLAGGIAQNLKNAFTPILIDTEVLMQEMGETDPSYPILDEILQATYQGIELVRNLLIFGRRTTPAKEHIDLIPVFREATDFLRASLPSTIEMRRSIEVMSAPVLADQSQIKQVIINLGSNAGHSMQKRGGMLEVDLSHDDLDGESAARISPDLAPGPYARIMVRDTGQGMDEETLKHIFEPFFTTKEKREGRGLGLPVVQGIVRDHHGAVAVESEPGKGTTFTVLLPELRQ